MFDIGWSELLLVATVAILVVGPKELPGMLRSLGQMLGKVRRTADEFRKHFDDAMREAGAEDLQREMRSLKQNNPLSQVRESIESAARDPMDTSSETTTKATQDEQSGDDDDLGPPPPPLPSKHPVVAPSKVTPPPAEATSQTASSSEPDDTDDKSTQHMNGEHRAAG